MYEVKCLKDFGCWSKKGKVIRLNNNLAERMEKRGIVEIIKNLGTNTETKESMKLKILKIEANIQTLKTKKKEYKKIYQYLINEDLKPKAKVEK